MSTGESTSNMPMNHAVKSEKATPTLTGICAKRIQMNIIEELGGLARLTNNLYNEANYRMRQKSFKTKTTLSYFEFYKGFKLLMNYISLPAKTT